MDHPGGSTSQFSPPRGVRRAAPLLAVAAAAVLLGAAAYADGGAAPAPFPTLDVRADTGWREPDSVKSVGGVLNVTMAVVATRLPVPIDSTNSFPLQAYQLLWVNGNQVNSAPSYPAPTFIVNPGDLVQIKLYNRMDSSSNTRCMSYPAANSGRDTMQDCFHGPTWTNIHYHGFHVTPGGTGDNVLLMIAPLDSMQYSFRIPTNQSPGTHWYHPHKHGSVALEVGNAMSGAFLVRNPTMGLDSLTAAYGIREVLAAVQQIDSLPNLVDGNDGFETVVNGLTAPDIPIAPNEVIRLRLVNENISSTADFQVFFPNDQGFKMFDIARDGVAYSNLNYERGRPDTALFIYPGNRLDLYVQAPPPSANLTNGRFELRIRTVRPQPQSLKVRAFNGDATQAEGVPLVRFRLTPSAATSYDTVLPPSLPALPRFLSNIGPTRDTAVVVFNDTGFVLRNPPGTPTEFYLGTANNHYMRFNDTTVYIPISTRNRPVPMVLGDSQTWRVQNFGVSKNHPFHIHINPFQILHVTYGPKDKFRDYYRFLNEAAARGAPIWSDVVPLPVLWVDSVGGKAVSHPGEVIIAQRYDPFTNCPNCGPAYGQFVMHCHILGHEERGMMQLLEIFQSRAAADRFVLTHPRLIANELGRGPAPRPYRRPTRPSGGYGRGGGHGGGGGNGGGGGGGTGHSPGGHDHGS